MEVFYEIVDFFVLDLCSKPIFCSKLLRKAKLARGQARTAKSLFTRQKLLKSCRAQSGKSLLHFKSMESFNYQFPDESSTFPGYFRKWHVQLIPLNSPVNKLSCSNSIILFRLTTLRFKIQARFIKNNVEGWKTQ